MKRREGNQILLEVNESHDITREGLPSCFLSGFIARHAADDEDFISSYVIPGKASLLNLRSFLSREEKRVRGPLF